MFAHEPSISRIVAIKAYMDEREIVLMPLRHVEHAKNGLF
jgi:hypothetical protein